MAETIETVKGERDRLKRKLNEQNRWAIRPAAIALFVLGLAVVALWALTNTGQTMSMLILLAGVTVIALALLLYFLSPARFLRAEVADALALSGTANLKRVLDAMLVEAPGVCVPSARAGTTRLFIPVSGALDPASVPRATGGTFITREAGTPGIMLEPPGYGLLAYMRQIGATFTDEGLENEVRDALENSLELASGVVVRREGDAITVSMRDLANAGMCAAVRKERPGTCTQTGCPVCSFVACAIAEGTGRMVRIKGVEFKDKVLNVSFSLI